MLITCKQAAELIGVENHRELQDIAKSTPPDLPGAPIRLGAGRNRYKNQKTTLLTVLIMILSISVLQNIARKHTVLRISNL